jgi:hypothetical protein
LLGHRAGENRRRSHALFKIGIAHAFELGASDDTAGLEIGLRGDRACGLRIIAGDHDHADTGGAAFLNGCRDGRAQRIRKTDKAEELQWKTTRRLGARNSGRYRCTRDGEYAHAFLRHLVDGTA